jgi:hypothetical protein
MSTFSYCANNGVVDCTDPFSILIFAILSLNSSTGSSLTDITQAIPTICPSVSWSESETETYITQATKRGILVTGVTGTYAINAAMARVNPINQQYYCVGLFYRCSPPGDL